nr:hypothetical protein [Tanacetum cinerariifolium]
MEKEELIVYLADALEAVSAVLITERVAKQMPVYLVSCTLQGSKINYTSMEKLVLALVHASKRIKRYFQAHTIIVITDQPIKQVLSRPKVIGRLLKWSIELRKYDIQYRPRTSVKGQILADFIVERPEDDPLDMPMEAEEELPGLWKLFMDGSSYVDGFRAGLILTNLEVAEFTYALRFRFDATNNEAEYEALIADLRIAEQIGVKNLQTNVDSRLVVNQVNGSYITKDPGMVQYIEKVKTVSGSFIKILIKQLPQSENKKVNALSKLASTSFAHLTKQVLVKELNEKSINKAKVSAVVEGEGDIWMTSIYNDLTKETLIAKKEKARAIRHKSGCMHAGTRYVVAKAIRTGYYWPPMYVDARKLIRECQDYQGIDIDGTFPEGPEKVKFQIVAMDYFTKWIEAKPIVTIMSNHVKNRVGQHSLQAPLDGRSKEWIEEIPRALWAQHTMIKSSNVDTLVSLTYSTEAIILAKNGMPTLRTTKIDMVQNDEDLKINLDLLTSSNLRSKKKGKDGKILLL